MSEKEFNAEEIVEKLNQKQTEADEAENRELDADSTETTPDQEPESSNEEVEEKDESKKVNMIKTKDLGSGQSREPGTRQHKYARGFGYNP